MNKFKAYLQNKGFADSSIQSYVYHTKKYLTFLKHRKITVRKAKYKTVIAFIKYLRRNNNDQSINSYLIAIRHYYNFLNVDNNPIKINLKRKPTMIATVSMSEEDLIALYHNFKVTDSKQSVRDKVLLSLFLFQGIHSYEVKAISMDDIDLKQMKITIRQSKLSNQRVLPIHIHQLIDLKHYMENVRSQFCNKSDLLIVTDSETNCVRSILNSLSKKITKQNTSFTHIRISRIKLWLKAFHLREVQYLSGHKFISSTERYITTDIQKLKDNIVRYHPL